MTDPVMLAFRGAEAGDAEALNRESAIVRLDPLQGDPPYSWLARFDAPCLVRLSSGEIATERGFVVGVRFPDDYLRRINPAEVVAFLHPANVFHPNIRAPFMCLGKIAPGTELRQLVTRAYEVAVFMRHTPNEFDALNAEACRYVRAHAPFAPLSTRPLKEARNGRR